VSKDVSEKHIASIFRVEEISTCHLLAELISWTLKMEAIYSSETSVDTQRPMQCYIPEDGTLQIKLILNKYYDSHCPLSRGFLIYSYTFLKLDPFPSIGVRGRTVLTQAGPLKN
jgi:hypothetical protein